MALSGFLLPGVLSLGPVASPGCGLWDGVLLNLNRFSKTGSFGGSMNLGMIVRILFGHGASRLGDRGRTAEDSARLANREFPILAFFFEPRVLQTLLDRDTFAGDSDRHLSEQVYTWKMK